MPEESSWGEIGAEAMKKIALSQRVIVDGIRPINPELAVKLEKCFLDGRTLMKNMGVTPEKIEGKLAAATFLQDYFDLYEHTTHLANPVILSRKGISDPAKIQEASSFLNGVAKGAWQFYEQYAKSQNLLNQARYSINEDEIIKKLRGL